MAPELIEGDGLYTKAVDVYSFGIILFEIVTQSVPYPDIPKRDLWKLVATGIRPTIPPTLNRNYAELMERCWHSSPGVRPTFDQIINDLNNI